MELQNFIQRLKELQKHAGSGTQIVQVLVESHGSLGGRKSVPIKDIQLGFDWESGRVLLTAEQVLTNISSDDVAAIVASKNKAQSWHSYQQHKQYAADNKMLQERVTELEAKLVRTQIAAYTLCDAVEDLNDLDELYEATTEARELLRKDADSGEAVDAAIDLFEPVVQSNQTNTVEDQIVDFLKFPATVREIKAALKLTDAEFSPPFNRLTTQGRIKRHKHNKRQWVDAKHFGRC